MSDKQSRVVLTDPIDLGFNAEEMAMFASLRSRSNLPTEELYKKVKDKGVEKFMEHYIGYGSGAKKGKVPGHGSIAQSGSTTINLDNISMLAALAVEDHPLFNGQECSTRYIDFSEASYHLPKVNKLNARDTFDEDAEKIIQRWFALYQKVFDATYENALKKYQKPQDADDKVWDRACKAYAFDVASGFLPAAAKTSLAWHTQLDNANREIQRLKTYPLEEVRALAQDMQASMVDRYPNSAKETMPEGHEEFDRENTINNNYSDISITMGFSEQVRGALLSQQGEMQTSWSLDAAKKGFKDEESSTHGAALIMSDVWQRQMANLPEYKYAPANLKSAGIIQIHGCLDLASFRELHRHRDGYIPVPYIDAKSGMYSWYMRSLPSSIKIDVQLEVSDLFDKIVDLQRLQPYEAQYLCPLGVRVAVEVNWAIPQLMYVCKLRTGHACREPIRIFAQLIADRFSKEFPDAKLYANMEPDQGPWFERGNADIKIEGKDGEQVNLSEEK